jgi:hypothetical protein
VSELEAIGGDVEALLARIGLPSLPPLARLVDAWEEVAGEPWAEARPAGLESGVLVVEVADGMRASLLSYQTGPLLDRLGGHLGPGVVHSVRIRVAMAKKSPKTRHSGAS